MIHFSPSSFYFCCLSPYLTLFVLYYYHTCIISFLSRSLFTLFYYNSLVSFIFSFLFSFTPYCLRKGDKKNVQLRLFYDQDWDKEQGLTFLEWGKMGWQWKDDCLSLKMTKIGSWTNYRFQNYDCPLNFEFFDSVQALKLCSDTLSLYLMTSPWLNPILRK